MKYFLDTGFLIALANKEDKYHQITVNQFLEIIDSTDFLFITSDHVVSEFLSFIMKKVSYNESVYWGEEFFEERRFEVIVSTQVILNSAWQIFRSQQKERKPLTYVDCVILETSKVYQPEMMLSYDNKLNQEFRNQFKS